MARGKKWNPRSTEIVAEDGVEELPPAGRMITPKSNPPPLEKYVEEAIRGAELVAASKGEDGSRALQAESYARWRWQGWVDGTIASL